MCGRYNIVTDAQAILDAYGIVADLFEPNYNAAPTQQLPIVRGDQLEFAHWGLVPYWAKDQKSAFKMINARAETITEKASFKGPIKKQRCLVPVTGWYEWLTEDGEKQPYLFETGELFTLAGIYAYNKQLDLLSFSIITTEANAQARQIHQRMPVILSQYQYDMWRDAETPLADVVSAMTPYRGNDLRIRPVNKALGNVRNTGPEVLEINAEVAATGSPPADKTTRS